jgi:hypothetical protein
MNTRAAPTPMPAFAPKLSPPPFESEDAVSVGRLEDSPGAGELVKAELVTTAETGTAVGVKGTQIRFASEEAYAGGNLVKSEASHPTHIASARASPFDTSVVLVRVVYARLPVDKPESHQYAVKIRAPGTLLVNGAYAVRGVVKVE